MSQLLEHTTTFFHNIIILGTDTNTLRLHDELGLFLELYNKLHVHLDGDMCMAAYGLLNITFPGIISPRDVRSSVEIGELWYWPRQP